jgi:gliding motility-associated-like protein
MKKSCCVIITLLLGLISFSNLKAQCAFLCNGDFENITPPVPVGNYGDRTEISGVPCWQTTEADQQIEIWHTGYGGGGAPVPSYSGTYFSELNANAASTLFQNFTIGGGVTVTISFAHRGRLGTDVMSVSIGPVGGPYTTLGNYSDGNAAWGYYTTSYNIPSSGNYSLQFTAVSSATGNLSAGNFLDAISVTTNPVWKAPSVIKNVTCKGGSDGSATANTFNPPNEYTYLWAPTGQTTQVAANLTKGTYSITVTDVLGCTDTRTVTITEPPLPTASISGNNTVCQNTASPLITFTGANGFAPYKFAYSKNGGTADTAVSVGGSTVTIAQPTNVASTFTYSLLSVTDAHGCTQAQGGLKTIQVNPLPIISSTSATICKGQGPPGILTASGANSYIWVTGATSNTISAAPSNTTSYSVVGNSLGCKDTAVGTITVNPLPIVNVTNDVICKAQGRAATITAGTADTYLWSTGATTASITIAPTATTAYTVTGTTLSCYSVATGTVTVNPVPVVTVASQTICFGKSAILTAATANSYHWSTGANTNTISVSPTANTTYTVIGNSLGCVDTTTATITVNPLPVVTATSDTICRAQGRAGILTASGANSYTWVTGATTNPISIAPLSTTTYSVVGNSLNCLGTATGTITVKPLPIVTVTVDTICKAQGRAGTITANGAVTYLWSTGATTASITDAPITSTTYTVTGTTLGCFTPVTTTITVNPIPSVSVTPQTICFGKLATLTATNANTYLWSTGAVTNSITASPATTATYNVIGNSLGCLDTVNVTITVNPLPIVKVTNDTICKAQGRAGTITASGASSYVWSTGAGTNSITDAPLNTTTYTVIGNTLGCLKVAKGTIKVNALPVVKVTPATICKGQATTLVATGAKGFVWSNGPTVGANTVNPLVNTTYTVIGTTLGCYDTVTTTVMVNPYPTVTIASVTICKGGTGILKAGGADSYVWSTGANVDSIIQSPVATTNYNVTGTSLNCSQTTSGSITVLNVSQALAIPQSICFGDSASIYAYGSSSYHWSTGATTNPLVVKPGSTTTYTLTGSGCPNSSTVQVTVYLLPKISTLPDSICDGETATVRAQDLLNSISVYSWSTGSDSNAILVSPHNPINTYTVVGATSFGCKDTATGTVVVHPNPILSVTSANICPNGTATLTVTATQPSLYRWSNNVVGNTVTASPSATSSYSVVGTTTYSCSGSGVGTIKVGKFPKAGFTASPNPTDIFDTEITFSNTSSVDVVYWHWDYGDGNTLAPNTASPIHTYPSQPGTYTVTLVVHNATPCWDSITSEIVISPEYAFYIPNSFTPNGDKTNNGFRGTGIGIANYKLQIFDRWGELIWQSTDLDEYWDGTIKGTITKEDAYVWKVFITDVFKKDHRYMGTVTVIR